MAATVLLTSLLSLSLGAVTSALGSTSPAGSGSQLVFTRNGAVVEQIQAPTNANDLHYVWSNERCLNGYAYPYIRLFWTLNGNVIGNPGLAPCRANDFEFAWNVDGTITTASWTVNGRIMEPSLSPPQGANDVHLFLTGKTHLLKAWWTYDGKPIQAIKIPGLVNDMHWYGYPIVATNGVPTYLYFTSYGKVVGRVPAPQQANDLHYVWTSGGCKNGYAFPYIRLLWTIDGKVIGSPTLAPCKANDFEFSWSPSGNVMSASWTMNGMVLANLAVPEGVPVNDVHLYLGQHLRLLSAWWTYDGQPISRIRIPGFVNDMHWYGYPITTASFPAVPEGFYR